MFENSNPIAQRGNIYQKGSLMEKLALNQEVLVHLTRPDLTEFPVRRGDTTVPPLCPTCSTLPTVK